MPKSCVISGIYGNDTHHSFDTRDELGLMIEELTIELPKVKTEISSPYGMHGSIDSSEYRTGFKGDSAVKSQIFYESRKIKIKFGVEDREKYYYALDNYDLKHMLHGSNREITFSDDPDYYYFGRMTVTSWDQYAIIPHITVEMLAHPFKREQFRDQYRHEVTNNNWIVGVTNDMVSLDSTRTTATTNTFSQSNGFSVRGTPGQISVWRIEIPQTGLMVWTLRRLTDIRYGGRWELRSPNWTVIDPVAFDLRGGVRSAGYFYIVFYCDYEVTYRWDRAIIIGCYEFFDVDVGDEPVYPYTFCNHENCVLIDFTQDQVVSIPQGGANCYDLLLLPGKHTLAFSCMIPDSSWTWDYIITVQRGYL